MQCPSFTLRSYGICHGDAPCAQAQVPAYRLEFYMQDCQGGITVDGTPYPAQKGSFSCAKPGQQVQIRLPRTCYFMHIDTQDQGLCALLKGLPTHGLLWDREQVASLFGEMLTMDAPDLPQNQMRLMGCVFGILSLTASPQPQLGESMALLHREALLQADRYIREHYAEDLDLAKVAAVCCLHPNYFHRLYTAAFGKTPAQQLLDCRIAAAKLALLTQDKPLRDIAAACGFSSQAYFSARFKEVTGCTPMQYRKSVTDAK